MAKRKIVCGELGTIYNARMLNDNTMSATDRIECTHECINAVVEHTISDYRYPSYGAMNVVKGNTKDGKRFVMSVYDPDRWELKEREV